MLNRQQIEENPTNRVALRMAVSSNAPSHPGGAERYAIDLAQGLAAQGVDTAYFASNFRTLTFNNPQIKLWPIRGTTFLPRFCKENIYSYRVRKAQADADIDVLVACNTVATADIAMCGGTHIGFLKAMQKKVRIRDQRKIKLETKMYQQASLIMAHSKLMRQELLDLYGLPAEKIWVLYPPVNHNRFTLVSKEKRKQLRKRFGFEDNEIVMLFPSSSHDRKGLKLVLEAVERMGSPFVLAVAGKKPEIDSEYIRYLGYIKNIEACYQAVDFSILAPLYEPFGLVGVESVLCGTPVIFPTNVGSTEVLDRSACYVFEPADLDGLCNILTIVKQRNNSDPNSLRVAKPEQSILYDYKIDSHVKEVIKMASFCMQSRGDRC